MKKHSIKKSRKLKSATLILKLVVLMVTLLLIFYKLNDPENFGYTFINQLSLLKNNAASIIFIGTSIVLMPVNWMLEALKWQKLVNKEYKISFYNALSGVLTGLSLGFITPHAIGEYAGRLWRLESNDKMKFIGSVWLGKVLQMTVTFLFGLIGVIVFYNNSNYKLPLVTIITILTLSIFVGLLILFFLKVKVSSWIAVIQSYFKIVLAYSFKELGLVFLLCVGRYLVFSIQFLLVLVALKIHLPIIKLFAGVSWIFLIKSIVPSFNFMSDLGVRELSALTYFDLFNANQSAVVAASLLIWLINILCPVLIGLYFVLKMKRSLK